MCRVHEVGTAPAVVDYAEKALLIHPTGLHHCPGFAAAAGPTPIDPVAMLDTGAPGAPLSAFCRTRPAFAAISFKSMPNQGAPRAGHSCSRIPLGDRPTYPPDEGLHPSPQSVLGTSSDEVARIHATPKPKVSAELRRTNGLSSNAAPRNES